MPGGSLHSPIWTPYALYGTVDYVYGWPAFDGKDGFTGAQGALNALETALYGVYLWIAYAYGVQEAGKLGRGSPGILGRRKIVGREAGVAVLIAFATAIMTLSKTVLYCEYLHFSLFIKFTVCASMFAVAWIGTG
jgi:hypothetical protein